RQGSAMHSSDRMLQSIYYGYDSSSFFIRIDGVQELSRLLKEDDVLNLHLIYDREYRLQLQMKSDEGLLQIKENGVWTPTGSYCRWKIARICEISIPLGGIKLAGGSKLFVSVTLVRDNEEAGRWPSDAPLMLYYAGADIELDNWLI
ncbi:MAG: glycoside hydrolase, partial [Desulfuromonadaceae bacterium]